MPHQGENVRIPISEDVYEELKQASKNTGKPVGEIISRGLRFAVIESIVNAQNGSLLVRMGKKDLGKIIAIIS